MIDSTSIFFGVDSQFLSVLYFDLKWPVAACIVVNVHAFISSVSSTAGLSMNHPGA